MPQQQQRGQQQGPSNGTFTFEQFAGVNTATVRAGVPDEQAYWLDGFMPLAPRQLRILPGVGPALYTRHSSNTIIGFGFYNISSTPYAVIFESDGSAYQYSFLNGAISTILPPGSIASPSLTTLGFSQYGQQYLLIVSTQTNGYWIWDGSVLYDAGSLSPVVTLTNVGAGYTSPPVVTATGGSGTGATFTAQIANGVVTGVSVTNPGSGYLPNDSVSLVFTGGNASGSGGSVTAALTQHAGGSGAVLTPVFTQVAQFVWDLTSVSVTAGGTGYSTLSTAVLNSGNGFWNGAGNAPPVLQLVLTGGSVVGVNIFPTSVNPTNGWTDNNPPPTFPAVTVSDPGYYFVSSTSIVAAGTGYGPNVRITVSGGGAPVQTAAVIVPTENGGSITSVAIKNAGVYGSNTPPTLTVTDSAITAAGTVSLMPLGISGNAVQTYQGRVWVFNGPVFNFTAPGSVSNFATSAGGGSQQSSDNFLRVGYTQAVQTNGFLFIIGDSSMNYISGVTTSGTPPTTTYTNQNSDPEIGTPFPYSVTTFGQEIFLANSAGVFVSSGGGFVKRSEMLDGVWNSVLNFGGMQLSSAKATIFNKRVWMVLAPIIDPVSGTQPIFTSAATVAGNNTLHFTAVPSTIVAGMLIYDASTPSAIPVGTTVLSTTSTTVVMSNNAAGFFNGVRQFDQIFFFTTKLLMTNGKQWWASLQDVTPLMFIATQEINSTFTAYGTDGITIYPLFEFASTQFIKTIQTKYWDAPGYEMTKAVTRFWSLWQAYSGAGSFQLVINAVGLDANNNQYESGYSATLSAAATAPQVVPTLPEAVAQNGVLVGFTITTLMADGALVSAKILPDSYQYRG